MADERERAARAEKMLGDFEEQAGKPFEHEARLKELLGRQTELNAALDLDKGERQIAPPAEAEGIAEIDGDAGADERAAVVETRVDRRYGGPRPDGIKRENNNFGAGNKPVSAPRTPLMPGTKF